MLGGASINLRKYRGNDMRNRLTALIFVAAVLSAAAPCRAEVQDVGVVAAKELLQALHATDQLKDKLPTIIVKARQVFLARYPQHAAQVEAIMPHLTQKFAPNMDELPNVIARIYAKKFTEAELREMTRFAQGPKDEAAQAAFRNSPTGAKFGFLQKDIARESQEVVEKWSVLVGSAVDEEIKSELKKRGVAL